MAKKPATTTESKSRTAPAAAMPSDVIQPALKLSELVNRGEVARKAFSDYQKMTEQVRASLQLPHLGIAKRHAEAAAAVSQSVADLESAQKRARAVVSRAFDLVPPSARKRVDDIATAVAITSTADMGRMVREVRQQRKLSQQAFADLAGVGRRFISELENGKATLEFGKVVQVASACGIDLLARRRR